MLSYQHIYHAGNHADVLKHISVLAVLNFLAQKSKPATLIDSHAGAGMYAIAAPQSKQTAEYHAGVASLARHLPDAESALLQQYLTVHQHYAQSQQYAGSVMLMHDWLREQDQLHGGELHPQAYAELASHINKRNAHVYQRDSFKLLDALLPPIHRRGCVLIDPPYEDFAEYQWVFDAVANGVSRWATACYAIWYPKLSTRAGDKTGQSQQLRDRLGALSGIKNAWYIEMDMQPFAADSGMYGSGMLLLNCPYQVDVNITGAIAEICRVWKADYPEISFHSKWLVEPT
jgi:23S rRNA (adenine2030-N6)-methyltransferase